MSRTVHDSVPPQVEYELTDEGWELVPVLQALYDWGTLRAKRTGVEIQPA